MRISAQPAELLSPPRLLARSWMALARITQPKLVPAHATGARGEVIAYWSLRQHGYTIVARNLRLPGREGELDLIAYQGKPPELVFIEVKTRTATGQVPAEDSVDVDKRQHLIRLARTYRRRRGYDGKFRFDVVAVYGPEGKTPRIELYRDAFQD